MKKNILKLIFWLVLVGMILLDILKGYEIFLKGDYKIALVSQQGLGLLSVSDKRGMLNLLTIGPDVMVWVPEGYGWYRSDKVFDLLKQENRKDLASHIFFYNFGFVENKIMWLDELMNWENWSNVVVELGFVASSYFKWKLSSLFFIQETINDQLVDNLKLDEILSQQFGSDVLIEEEVRVSVFNASGENMLATFMAERLDWLGLGVLTVGDYQTNEENCLISYGLGVEKSKTLEVIKARFDKCQIGLGKELLESEIEIVLGSDWVEMVNYGSYVRSF